MELFWKMTQKKVKVLNMKIDQRNVKTRGVVFFLSLSLICYIYLLTGCTVYSSRILSEKTDLPFVNWQGKTVQLESPLTIHLSEDQMGKTNMDSAYLYFSYMPYKTPIASTNNIPRLLPAGTKIRFNEFYCSKRWLICLLPFPYDFRYEAEFEVLDMDIPKNAKFVYLWGKGLYLHRAPWEDESAPESRYVGFNGRGYSPIKKDEVQKPKP
jgi:hypothetical protein